MENLPDFILIITDDNERHSNIEPWFEFFETSSRLNQQRANLGQKQIVFLFLSFLSNILSV